MSVGLLGSMVYWLIWNWVLWGCINFFGKVWPEIKGVAYTIVKKGVYFHELFHYLMMKVLWMKVAIADIRVEGGSGSVSFRKTGAESPIKIFLVAVAPWVFGSILINYVFVFFAQFTSPTLVYTLLLFVLKWWVVAMLVLTLPPSFGDIKLVLSTITERFLVFCKHVVLLLGSFLAYVNNIFNVVEVREWIFRVSVPYLSVFEYYIRPLAEYLVILLIFAIFDGLIFLVKYSVKNVYRYYSKDRKFQLKPTEYMAYLGNEFIAAEFEQKPHHMSPKDMVARQDADIKQAFLAEMERNL